MFPLGITNQEKYYYQMGQFDMLLTFLREDSKISNNKIYILDRSHFGERVWGAHYRNCYPNYMDNFDKELNAIPNLKINMFLI